MKKQFWTIVVAFLFIFCLASVADAQRRAKPQRGFHPGNGQPGVPGNQDENPGNGNQGENPGNGNQGEDPQGPGNGTPDGETPALEATCDDLKHGTPGLYGLCVAFCEAHDCVITVTSDGELDFSQCKKNDGKILAKYQARMRDGDPDMPCLPATQANEEPENACPCWSQEQLDNFPYAPAGGALVLYSGVDCTSFSEWDNDQKVDLDNNFVSETMELDGGWGYADFGTIGAENASNNSCFGVFRCEELDCSGWLPDQDWFIENLEPDVYLECLAQLEQLKSDIGCSP